MHLDSSPFPPVIFNYTKWSPNQLNQREGSNFPVVQETTGKRSSDLLEQVDSVTETHGGALCLGGRGCHDGH